MTCRQKFQHGMAQSYFLLRVWGRCNERLKITTFAQYFRMGTCRIFKQTLQGIRKTRLQKKIRGAITLRGQNTQCKLNILVPIVYNFKVKGRSQPEILSGVGKETLNIFCNVSICVLQKMNGIVINRTCLQNFEHGLVQSYFL